MTRSFYGGMLDRFSDSLPTPPRSIAVVGDIIIDRYLFGTSTRANPEGEGIVVEVRRMEERLGGAAAVALLAKAMGADVTLLGHVTPESAILVEDTMLREGIALRVSYGRQDRTTVKQRVVCDGRLMPDRCDFDYVNVTPPIADLPDVDCVLVADYGKGYCAGNRLRHVLKHPLAIVDPARGRDWHDYQGAKVIKPNLLEATLLATCGGTWEMASQLSDKHGVEVVLTLGDEGMVYAGTAGRVQIPAEPASLVDITGAGDTVLAALGVVWGTMPPADCCRFAARMAAKQVESLGIAAVS
jgi:rfaE bifunctional protein kinase chain/domain